MTTFSWLLTIGHVCLFLYLRIKYVRKFKKAEKRAAQFEVENIGLKNRVGTLQKILSSKL